MDINPGAADANPTEIRTVNGVTYFFANNPELGNELWQTDCTTAGTRPVADLNQGAESGSNFSNVDVSAYDFYGMELGNEFYFAGTNGNQAGLYATRPPSEPLPVTARITNNCRSGCVWDLPKKALLTGKTNMKGTPAGMRLRSTELDLSWLSGINGFLHMRRSSTLLWVIESLKKIQHQKKLRITVNCIFYRDGKHSYP